MALSSVEEETRRAKGKERAGEDKPSAFPSSPYPVHRSWNALSVERWGTGYYVGATASP